MASYYKYNFISAESIYAIVKEEFKTYFDTGSVDDLLFPIYVNKCLRKLENSTYPLIEELLHIQDFEARLPINFHAVREAWMCGDIKTTTYNSSTSQYYQNIIVLPHLDIKTCPTKNCDLQGVFSLQPVDTNTCKDNSCHKSIDLNDLDIIKVTNTHIQSVRKMYMLQPGNISAKQHCDVDYNSNWNMYGQQQLDTNFIPYSSRCNSFDIRDGKLVTNFRDGIIHLLYYATNSDDCGNQLVPDNFRILEYIEKFLKYKILETLTNQVNDETFNQLQQKMIFAKQEADEAYILANIEVKKQTIYKKQQTMFQERRRFNQYRIR